MILNDILAYSPIMRRETMQEDEERLILEAIFNHTHNMIAYLDKGFNFIRVNRAYALADNRHVDFFKGKNHFDLYPNKENEMIFQEVVKSGKAHFELAKPFEYVKHPERRRSYWDWNLVPIKNKDGTVSGLILTLQNVTEHIESLEKLKESEKRFKLLFKETPIPIREIDLSKLLKHFKHLRAKGIDDFYEYFSSNPTEIRKFAEMTIDVRMNDAALKFFNVENLEEYLDIRMDIFDSRDLKTQLDIARTYLQLVSGKKTIEIPRIQTIIGQKITSYQRAIVVPGTEETLSQVLVANVDLTEILQAEHQQYELTRALSESEEKYRLLVDNIPAVTWISSKGGETSFISSNVDRVYGYTQEEILTGGEDLWFGRIHHDDVNLVKESYRILFEREKKYDIEYRIKRKDDQWIWIHDMAIATYEEDGILYGYGIFTDVTDRKEAEIARRDLELKRSEFITLASHELRTPLTILKGYLDIFKKHYGNLSDADLNRGFLIANKNVKRLEKLISGVSELARIERDILLLNIERIEVNSFLREVMIAYEDLLENQISYFYPTGEDSCFVEADPEKLAQVLDNVIQNAVKHTSDSDREILVEVNTQMKNLLKIVIRDNGAGIAPKNVKQIFNPFVSIPTKYSVQGTGIGLFISKNIVEKMNGKIYAESDGLDKGCTFTIELPTHFVNEKS